MQTMRLHQSEFYKHRPKSELKRAEKENKSVQKNKKSASMNTSGFFSAKNTINQDSTNFKGNAGQKILTSKPFLNFAKMSKSQAMVEAFSALILAGVLRPATILATGKGKDDKDTQYAAVHGIASATIGYAFTVAITSPIKKGAEKLMKKLKNNPDFMKNSYLKAGENASQEAIEKAAKYADNFKLVAEYVPQMVLVPFRAALTVALIPPIMKVLFPNHKKTQKVEEKNTQTTQNQVKEQANASK